MSRLLITTVGTSLLTNRDARPWAPWNGRDGDPLPDVGVVNEWLAGANPVAASAETNTLQAIGVQPSDRVRFLHSDTDEGRFCSERLQHFYTHTVKCREVTGRSLTALTYSQVAFSQKGLKVLVEEAIKAVREAREGSLQPVFCATGGFKAEIAFLNLLGALLEIEVYYIHEQFRGEIVRLPRLPLAWDADWVLRHQNFFDWIDEEPRRTNEVESWLKGHPELRPLVEEVEEADEGRFSYLNAAGDLLFRAAKERGPRATWPASAAKLPEKKNGLSDKPHHRPHGWQGFVSKLCEIDCVEWVDYDETAYGGEHVKVLAGNKGHIAVRYGAAGNELPLRVETSARGPAQTELVAEYIMRQLF